MRTTSSARAPTTARRWVLASVRRVGTPVPLLQASRSKTSSSCAPPEGAESTYTDYVTYEWARRWPAELICAPAPQLRSHVSRHLAVSEVAKAISVEHVGAASARCDRRRGAREDASRSRGSRTLRGPARRGRPIGVAMNDASGACDCATSAASPKAATASAVGTSVIPGKSNPDALAYDGSLPPRRRWRQRARSPQPALRRDVRGKDGPHRKPEDNHVIRAAGARSGRVEEPQRVAPHRHDVRLSGAESIAAIVECDHARPPRAAIAQRRIFVEQPSDVSAEIENRRRRRHLPRRTPSPVTKRRRYRRRPARVREFRPRPPAGPSAARSARSRSARPDRCGPGHSPRSSKRARTRKRRRAFASGTGFAPGCGAAPCAARWRERVGIEPTSRLATALTSFED